MCVELSYFRIFELLFTLCINCGDEILNLYGIIYNFSDEVDSYESTSRVCKLSLRSSHEST